MEAIQKSAEHHFLTILQGLKKAPQGYAVLHFALSKRLDHSKILENSSAINKTLSTARKASEEEFQFFKDKMRDIPKGYLYLFEDNDIILIAPFRSDMDKERLQKLYENFAKRLQDDQADFSLLEHEFNKFQKLADQKMLSAKAVNAYRSMADIFKVNSISVRRERREHPIVQVIEDDRFTASYTSNILAKEYDLVLSRNGEDGILHYIENAPDIIFIDIHLPGLSGHEVLESLKAIDPNVFAVMLSADAVKDNIVKSAEGGANNFLKKPFSKDKILNIVKNSPYVRATVNKNASSLRTH